jgi:hypothetical protein
MENTVIFVNKLQKIHFYFVKEEYRYQFQKIMQIQSNAEKRIVKIVIDLDKQD